MGQHKTPKLTATLILSLAERVQLHQRIRTVPPGDRDGERAWLRVWDALDFDGALAMGKVEPTGQISFTAGDLRKKSRCALDLAHVETLLKMPPARTVEEARSFQPIREQLEKAKEQLGK